MLAIQVALPGARPPIWAVRIGSMLYGPGDCGVALIKQGQTNLL
ncbi:hypothetical protein [Nonomuraea sp. NPDC049141]